MNKEEADKLKVGGMVWWHGNVYDIKNISAYGYELEKKRLVIQGVLEGDEPFMVDADDCDAT